MTRWFVPHVFSRQRNAVKRLEGPTLRCAWCKRPRDNKHESLCPICLLKKSQKEEDKC